MLPPVFVRQVIHTAVIDVNFCQGAKHWGCHALRLALRRMPWRSGLESGARGACRRLKRLA